ncbi:MAG: DUF308 domain-containing protein [Solirubrobacterales bacterium]|nr:DUF308 domain-containing protein [Solirubrobacterales bacterium]MCB8914646.1 DUF308 domain-containing protein [Thermoleophilales bacterium]
MEYNATPEKEVKRVSGMFTGIGILMILVGCFAVVAPHIVGKAFALLVGLAFIIASVFIFVWAFSAEGGVAVVGRIAWSLVSLIAGLIIVTHTSLSAKAFTAILIAYFLAAGVVRLAAAFAQRGVPGAGWLGLNGALSLIIGLIFVASWPNSAEWAIGLLIGIDLIFSGWTLILLSQEAKSEVLSE